MQMILVIGATGQLGRAVIGRLRGRAGAVRALVRSPESAANFQTVGVEPVLGDLTDADSLGRACVSVTAVVATANAAVPTRSSDTFTAVDCDGYRNLIRAAAAAGVRRFVYTSAPLSKHERLSPLLGAKRATERDLERSGLDHVIFRADIFMDIAFAMMGSEIPLRGSEGATALRPFAFANRHFARIKDSIEQKGVAMIPGDGTSRHAFICVDDVAEFMATATIGGPSGVYDLGGPDALTFVDVVHIYERIVGRTIAVKRTPVGVFRTMAAVLKPFSPAAANLMALNYIAAKESTEPDGRAAAAFGVRLTSAEDFLRAKAAMAAARSSVP
jgi:uncharacterized protein YbjT (DUF2867 family)